MSKESDVIKILSFGANDVLLVRCTFDMGRMS